MLLVVRDVFLTFAAYHEVSIRRAMYSSAASHIIPPRCLRRIYEANGITQNNN